MSAGFRAGGSSDAYLQVDGVDKIKIDNSAVTLSTTDGLVVGGAAGYITVAPTAEDSAFLLNKPVGTYTSALYGARNNLIRWSMEMGNTTSESGSDVGSDFAINRYSDAGGFVASALSINRASGASTFAGPVYITSQPYFIGWIGNETAIGVKSITTQASVGITNSGTTLTVPVTGRYLVMAQQLIQPSSNSGYWSVQRNGSDHRYAYYTPGMASIGPIDMNVSFIAQLAAGDTLRINQTQVISASYGSPHSAISVELLG